VLNVASSHGVGPTILADYFIIEGIRSQPLLIVLLLREGAVNGDANGTRRRIDNTPELRDARFHATCLLDHANPENDADYLDVPPAN